jgi:hypothetical protein
MQRNLLRQSTLAVLIVLFALSAIGSWLFMPTASLGARPTEYKVVPLPAFLQPGTLKKDVMKSSPREIEEEKSAAEAAILQQALDKHGKEGWELVTIAVNGMLIFKR